MTQALGVLILLAVAAGAVYVVFRPRWALVLVLTLFPLKQLIQSYLPAFAVNSSLFNFIIFGVVALAVLARIQRRDGAFSGYANRVSILIWTLYAFGLLGLLYTPGRESALELAGDGAPYWLMMVLLLPLVIVNLEDFRKVLPAFMLVGTIICLLIFVNPSARYTSGRLFMDIGSTIGVSDLRGNPLITATMGAQVAMVAFLFRPERPSLVLTVLRFTALVTGMGLAVVSGSRGNTVFAVVVAVACFPLARRVADVRQFFLTSAGFAILAGAMFMTFRFFLGRDRDQQTRWDLASWDQPIQDRLVPISALFEAYISSPAHWLFGLGTNAYSSVLNKHRGYSHNLVAELLCEHGIFGLGLFLITSFFAFRLGRELWRTYADDPARRAAVATLLALCIYVLLLQMKEGTFISLPVLWAMWVIMAKIATHERLARRAELAAELSWAEEYADYGSDDAAGGEPPDEEALALR